MNADLRSAAVILPTKRGNIPRVMTFDDHNDAYDVMLAFGKAGIEAWMIRFEHYGPGQKPADMPAVQESMF